MHIAATTHEHGAIPKIYNYEADFDVRDDVIVWKAVVRRGADRRRTFVGTIPLTSPAVASLAEQAVRDEIIKRIDTFEDQSAGLGGSGSAA